MVVTIDSILSMQLVTVFGFPYNDSISSVYRTIWSLFPPNLLAKALNLLADATSTPQDIGISWSRRGECAPNDEECVITIVWKQTDSQTQNICYSSSSWWSFLHINLNMSWNFAWQNDIYLWLISTFLLWFLLAIYLDNIIPNVSGVRKPVFYFLNPGYWTGKGGNKVEGNLSVKVT